MNSQLFLSTKKCFDDKGNTVETGTLILISPSQAYGYDKEMEHSFSLKQLQNTDFFIQVPSPKEEETTVTVLIVGKTPYFNRTLTLPKEDIGERVFNLMEYVKKKL